VGTARQALIEHPVEANPVEANPVASLAASAPLALSETGEIDLSTLSPYKAARARANARLRAKLVAAQKPDPDAVRKAFVDLIVLMDCVRKTAALVEKDPEGSLRGIENISLNTPVLTISHATPERIPAAPERISHDFEIESAIEDPAIEDFADESPNPAVIESAAPHADAEPEIWNSNDPKRREKVAPALVNFHVDMEVPRVSPFIIEQGQNASNSEDPDE